MITVPAFPDLLKPGASVRVHRHPEFAFEGVVYRQWIGIDDCIRSDVIEPRPRIHPEIEFPRWFSGPTWRTELILDDPDRIGQTLALGWLARRLGVPMPEAGSPQWRRVIDMHTSERVIGYALGPDPYAIDPHSGVAGRAGWLEEGPRLARFTNRPGRVGLETLCPALDKPDAGDAPIRALALFVETVGKRAT